MNIQFLDISIAVCMQLHKLIRCEFDRKLTLFLIVVVEMFVELCHNMSYNPTSFDDFPRKKSLGNHPTRATHQPPKLYFIGVNSLRNRLLIYHIHEFGKCFLCLLNGMPIFSPFELKSDANYFVYTSTSERNENMN